MNEFATRKILSANMPASPTTKVQTLEPSKLTLNRSSLSAKINRMLTPKIEENLNSKSFAIQSLDALLLECQDFVDDLINSTTRDGHSSSFRSSLHVEQTLPSQMYVGRSQVLSIQRVPSPRLHSLTLSQEEESMTIKSLNAQCQTSNNSVEDQGKKSQKVFLGALQSLNLSFFGKQSQDPIKKKSRFSFDSFKNQFSKIVTSYRLSTHPMEEEESKKLNSLKYTNSVFF